MAILIKNTCNVTGYLGGYMGLLLGASVITVVEVLDLIVYNLLKQNKSISPIKPSTTESEHVRSQDLHHRGYMATTSGARQKRIRYGRGFNACFRKKIIPSNCKSTDVGNLCWKW